MADLGNNVRSPSLINIEHPSGSQGMEVEHSGVSKEPDIRSVATLRTARRIFEGNVLVPAGIWPSYKAVVDSIC
jgi:2-methylaconitate cis-trans-isomerase PrpF